MEPPPPPPPEVAAEPVQAEESSPTRISRPAASLILRLLAMASLIVSIILLTTNSVTIEIQGSFVELRFKDVYAYRYVVSAAVIGLGYTIMQNFYTISQIATGTAESNQLFDFYGDKVMSYVLATGSAAGFGVTKDLKDFILGLIAFDFADPINDFFNKGYASAGLLLLAFLCTAVLSVFSSYSLPKRQTGS